MRINRQIRAAGIQMVRRTIWRESNDNKPWRMEGMFVDDETKEKKRILLLSKGVTAQLLNSGPGWQLSRSGAEL